MWWHSWNFSIMSILFYITLTTGQEQKEWFVFSRSLDSLTRCVREHLSNNNLDLNHNEIQAMSKMMAQRFFEKSFTDIDLKTAINRLLKHIHENYFENYKNPDNLKKTIRVALEHCADIPAEPPRFNNEPSVLARVLDYILVDWPTPLMLMIRTAEGRTLLRSYAQQARSALEMALHTIPNVNNFRDEIRSLWVRRAQSYYDGTNRFLSYFRHGFNLNRRLHSYGNVAFFRTQSSRNDFIVRNPFVEQSEVNHFMYLHAADLPNYVYRQNNIFSHYGSYESSFMRSADHYIETRIDRFYVILRFTQLLEYRSGLWPGEDDPYDQAVPINVLPIVYQEMIYNNDTYRQLLIHERNLLNAHLERYGLRSQIEMGLILSSLNFYGSYLSRMINGRFFTADSPLGSSTEVENLLCLILDYILVDWSPEFLRNIIHDREGQTMLRSFAEQGQAALLFFLRRRNNRISFRNSIRRIWLRKTLLYFDGRYNNSRLQYIPHRYSIDGRVHVDPESLPAFYGRSIIDFGLRNPTVSNRSLVDDFLQTHPSTSSDDYYSRYHNNSQAMTTADYYLETHIDQFYRIIYYFNANMRGVIPNTFSEDLQILFNNEDYGYALQVGRSFLEMQMINNNQLRIFMRGNNSDNSIQDEDVIFWLMIQNSPTRTTTTPAIGTPIGTTVNFNFTSTTPKTEKEENDSLVYEDEEPPCKRSRKNYLTKNDECRRDEHHTQQYTGQNNNYNSKFYGYYEANNLINKLPQKLFISLMDATIQI